MKTVIISMENEIAYRFCDYLKAVKESPVHTGFEHEKAVKTAVNWRVFGFRFLFSFNEGTTDFIIYLLKMLALDRIHLRDKIYRIIQSLRKEKSNGLKS